ALWRHAPLRLPLDAVVADRGSRIEGVGDLLVGRRLKVAGVGGVARPDAGKAVGLQLGADRAALRAGLVAAPLVQDAEQLLDVVTVLVRDDVALRERPDLGAETLL